MNTLESRSILNSKLPRGFPVSEPRVIKKYPNRRLYDTVESRYITLTDIRRLVMDEIDFVVIDKKSQGDITRSILLQVIAEQEHTAEPLMSRDFLTQVIRSYGGSMPGLVGSYLEQSLKLLSSQTLREPSNGDAGDMIGSLAQMHIERWRRLQDDLFRTMNRTSPGQPEERAGESVQDHN
jgi:polyhydroxyalkanoate synthesis repressor PhaR